MAKTSRPKHPRPNCPGSNRPMAKLSEHHIIGISASAGLDVNVRRLCKKKNAIVDSTNTGVVGLNV